MLETFVVILDLFTPFASIHRVSHDDLLLPIDQEQSRLVCNNEGVALGLDLSRLWRAERQPSATEMAWSSL